MSLRCRTCLLALLFLSGALFAPSAQAHFRMVAPVARNNGSSGEIKQAPCGVAGSARSQRISTFRPGEVIHLQWDEYIMHPGHYRIAFDADGHDDFQDPSSYEDRNTNAAVLIDGIAAHTEEIDITLPDLECNNCTLQIIQVMTDKPPYGNGDDIYYQCIDLVLSRSANTDAGLDAGASDSNVADANVGDAIIQDAGSADASFSENSSGGCTISARQNDTKPFVLLMIALGLGFFLRGRTARLQIARASVFLVVLALAACAEEPPAVEDESSEQVLRGSAVSTRDRAIVSVRKNGKGHCSGTLLESNLLLSARHCFFETTEPTKYNFVYGEELDRSLFTFSMRKPDGEELEMVSGYSEIFFPASENARGADIALLVLNTPFETEFEAFTFSSEFDDQPAAGDALRTVGFGRTETGATQAARATITTANRGATNRILYAESTCPGDSGGPVMARSARTILGVNSTSSARLNASGVCVPSSDRTNAFSEATSFRAIAGFLTTAKEAAANSRQ